MMFILTIVSGLLALQDVERELFDRRDEARGAFLATPHGIYAHYCGHCHGNDAKGGGRLWASELSPSPPDLTATRLEEAALKEFITQGSSASGRSSLCPPWGKTISPLDVERLAGYVASLGGRTPPKRQGSALTAAPGSIPWLWVGAILGEFVLLGWLLFRRRREKSSRATLSEKVSD